MTTTTRRSGDVTRPLPGRAVGGDGITTNRARESASFAWLPGPVWDSRWAQAELCRALPSEAPGNEADDGRADKGRSGEA